MADTYEVVFEAWKPGVEKQKAYWANAAEYCRDIIRTEHTTRTPESVKGVLTKIAHYAALAEDPTCDRRADFLQLLDVPSVEEVLVEPIRPCCFRSTAVQSTQ